MEKRDVVLLKIEMRPMMTEQIFEYRMCVERWMLRFLVEIIFGNTVVVKFFPSIGI